MGISHEKSHKKLSVLYISENNNKINELTSYLKDFGFFVNEADYNFNITDALNGNENSFDVVVVQNPGHAAQ